MPRQKRTTPSETPEDVTYTRVDKLVIVRGPVYRARVTYGGSRIVKVERGSDGSGRITTAGGAEHHIEAARLE